MSHHFFASLIVALSRKESGMKKFIVMLLGVTATLAGQAAAQGPVEMIASDGGGGVYLQAVDGSKNAFVGDALEPAWSPDGSRIAFVRYSQPGLFVLKLGDWSFVNVRNRGTSPAWSPDGRKLAFSDGELFVMNADGSSVVQLTNNVGFRGQPAWSPDGSTIAFDCEVESGNTDICASNADGMGFRRLTFDPGWDSGAAFSPDGFAIAFATTRYGLDSQSNSQIAIMYFNGTGVSPVGAFGSQPAWSPDGNRIAFVVVSYVEGGGYFCNGCGAPCPIPPTYTTYIMNRDGTEQREFTTNGTHPKWALEVRPVALFVSPYGCDGLNCAFDGSRSWGGDGAMSYTWNFGDGRDPQVGRTVTHAYAAIGTYRVTLTVKDGAGVIGTQSQDFVVNISPTARFTYACSAWRCTFDGSGSSDPDGSITSYYWAFGDGVSAEGSTVTHIYNAAAAFTVTFRVYDNRGAWGRQQQVVDLSNLVNAPPVARFKATCTALMCTFDGSSSSDPDGIITTYTWAFGDGATLSSSYPSYPQAYHTYAAEGTYGVRLTVTDNIGATGIQDGSVTLPPPMHIGDLDGVRTNHYGTWTADVTIAVHDGNHGPVPNATVSGSWSIGGTGSCTTGGSGQCLISRSTIARNTRSVTFTIVNVTTPIIVTTPMFLYKPGFNHDPDGDSNGTSITVNSP